MNMAGNCSTACLVNERRHPLDSSVGYLSTLNQLQRLYSVDLSESIVTYDKMQRNGEEVVVTYFKILTVPAFAWRN